MIGILARKVIVVRSGHSGIILLVGVVWNTALHDMA